MDELRKKTFKNGVVYCLQLEDGFLVETTDTFLPYYTKDAIGRHQNKLDNNELGDRTERWMIGVSTMSGCPVRCKFCATGNMKRYRNLTADEIVAQVEFAISHAGGCCVVQLCPSFIQIYTKSLVDIFLWVSHLFKMVYQCLHRTGFLEAIRTFVWVVRPHFSI